MRTCIGLIVGLSQVALLCLNSCAVLCVHSDGQAVMEWSHDTCCQTDQDHSSPNIAHDHQHCTDHALLKHSLQQPHRIEGDFSALHLAPAPDAARMKTAILKMYVPQGSAYANRAPPIAPTLAQLRTVVILC